jgi:serine/threonine-protein kinase RIO1
LNRDLKNLNRYFNRLGVTIKSVEDAFKWVVKDG